MQALILAAGMGKRLGEHTKDKTKCMVDVNGQTLIEHVLQILNDAEITKLVLVSGYQHEVLREFVGDRYLNVEIEYVVNSEYDKTNNVYSLYLAREHLLEDDTLLLESDLIFESGIVTGVLDDPRPNLAVVDKHQSWMDGTVVELDNDDNIRRFVSKHAIEYRDVENYFKTVNIYKFSREFSTRTYVPFLEAYSAALGKNEYYEQVLKVIATLDTDELKAYRLTGEKWYEIDDPQDKDNAETIFAQTPDDKLDRVQRRHGGYWRYPFLKDFCYLVNPYFPTARMEDEIEANLHDLLSQYPSGSEVQSLLASQLFGTRPDQIVVGNGAAELIRIASQALPGKVGVVYPTFNEYPESIGVERVVPLSPDNGDFTYTVNDLVTLAVDCKTVLLINPDNPTGHFIEKQDILRLAQQLRRMKRNLLVDESFVDFCEQGTDETLMDARLLDENENLIVIKSIGKSYGVPGARLGVLATSNPSILAQIRKAMPIWNVNSFGEFFLQIIGKYKDAYAEACEKVGAERHWLQGELQKIDYLRVIPSAANYFMCEVVSETSATELTQALLDKHDVFIKGLTGKIGLETGEFVRIAVRNRDDNEVLIQALQELATGYGSPSSIPSTHSVSATFDGSSQLLSETRSGPQQPASA